MPKAIVFLLDGEHRGFGGINSLNEALLRSPLAGDYEFHRSGLNEIQSFTDHMSDSRAPVLFIFDEVMTWAKLPKILQFQRRVAGWARREGRCFRFIAREHHYSEGFVKYCVPSRLRFYLMLKLYYRMMDAVVAISNAQYRWILEHQLCAENKLTWFPQAIDVGSLVDIEYASSEKERAREWRYDRKVVVFGAIGRFKFQKGFDQLLKGWRSLANRPDVKLLIAGDGDDADELRLISEGYENVEFVGLISEPHVFYEMCDFIIIPSRYEPFGQVCLESRAAGRPVIVSSADGLPEQIEDGGGFTFEESNEREMVDRILQAVDLGRSTSGKYGTMCKQARQSAQLSWERFLSSFERELISSL